MDKKYYKIKDVSEFIGIPQSTLRFWELEFKELKPMRSSRGVRYYTPDDIKLIEIIYFLLKTKGMKIESAKYQLATNRKNISRRLTVIDNLRNIRNDLFEILGGLKKRKDNDRD